MHFVMECLQRMKLWLCILPLAICIPKQITSPLVLLYIISLQSNRSQIVSKCTLSISWRTYP
eukprot:15354709-Ditylum_brightwellii.AAC.1